MFTLPKEPHAVVVIRVDDDEHAHRVGAVIEALGYTVLRELTTADPAANRRWIISKMARRFRWTPREQEIAELILQLKSPREISAALELSRSTIKWHTSNLMNKSGVSNREELLCRVLDSYILRPAEPSPEPSPEPRTPAAAPSKSWF